MHVCMNGTVYTDIWMEAKGEILLPLKTPLLGIFMRIRMMCPCKCWFSCFSSTYQKCSLLFPFIRPWPWLTEVQKALPVPLEPNGNISLLFHHRDCRKTQNSNAAIDKFIMRSERTNSRFHHLAHQQHFPMNYLLAPLLLSCPLLLMW